MNTVINNRRKEIEKLLQSHQTISIMGMPGAGISLLLRELAVSNMGHSIYIDVFSLPELSTHSLVAALAQKLDIEGEDLTQSQLINACLKQLEKLTKNNRRVIIYFAGFDQLQPAMDQELLQFLQALSRSNEKSVKLIFGICVSLKKLIPDALFDSGLRLFGNTYYIGKYSDKELLYFLEKYGPAEAKNDPQLPAKLYLAGGHFQLLLTLLNNKAEISDGISDTTNFLFKNLSQLLLKPQRTILRNIAVGKKNILRDEYLLGIGMVNETGSGYELFSPLFTEYLAKTSGKHLPAKERRLYLLLKKNINQVVPKQEIMDVVWQGQITSDWSLNSLVYRLRKHPTFIAKDYNIESHKKAGFRLVKNP